MSQLRILLVDDHEVVRIGLRTLLGHHEHFQVVGEASTADEAVALAARLEPDVVLMDIRLPGRDGIDACAEITRLCPETRVIMLTSYAEDALLFDAISAGAAGYVLKQIGSEGLIASIEAVARGQSLLDPAVTERVFNRVRESVERERRDSVAALSSQEVRIIALLSKGKPNREIADVLGLGEKTVRNYVSSILSKLHLGNRAEAAAYAVRHHLADLGDHPVESTS